MADTWHLPTQVLKMSYLILDWLLYKIKDMSCPCMTTSKLVLLRMCTYNFEDEKIQTSVTMTTNTMKMRTERTTEMTCISSKRLPQTTNNAQHSQSLFYNQPLPTFNGSVSVVSLTVWCHRDVNVLVCFIATYLTFRLFKTIFLNSPTEWGNLNRIEFFSPWKTCVCFETEMVCRAVWRGPNKALRAEWPRPTSVRSPIITVMTVARCYCDGTPISN